MFTLSILTDLGAKCPGAYPYAFLWGTYCCKNKNESTAIDPIKECDGSSISIDSVCCKNDEYVKCPSDNECTGSRGSINPIETSDNRIHKMLDYY